jgi:hypothetical protein
MKDCGVNVGKGIPSSLYDLMVNMTYCNKKACLNFAARPEDYSDVLNISMLSGI